MLYMLCRDSTNTKAYESYGLLPKFYARLPVDGGQPHIVAMKGSVLGIFREHLPAA